MYDKNEGVSLLGDWFLAFIFVAIIVVGVLFELEKNGMFSNVKSIRTNTYLNVDQLSPIEYENFVAAVMKRKGYKKVRVTKGSGDFGADVLMEDKNKRKICIQCKRYQKPVGYKAVQEVYSAKGYYKCDEAWVCSTHGFTKNAQEGAKRLGVKLYTIR